MQRIIVWGIAGLVVIVALIWVLSPGGPPVEPMVSEPAPVEPMVSEPAPVEPMVSEPAPAEAPVAEPAPTEPAPATGN